MVLCLLLVGLAGVEGYLLHDYFTKNKSNPANTSRSTTGSTPAAAAPATANDVISRVKKNVRGISNNQDGLANAPTYQVKGYSFASYIDPTAKIAYTRSETEAVTVYNKIEGTLRALELSPQKQVGARAGEDSTGSPLDFIGTAVRCRLHQTAPAAQTTVTLACADTDDYAKASEAIAPLYALYRKEGGPAAANVAASTPVIRSPLIKESKTLGYATTALTIQSSDGSTQQFFYQTPDKTWHYFTSSQDTVACVKYDTDDLKKAFLGEPCADTAARRSDTVKL